MVPQHSSCITHHKTCWQDKATKNYQVWLYSIWDREYTFIPLIFLDYISSVLEFWFLIFLSKKADKNWVIETNKRCPNFNCHTNGHTIDPLEYHTYCINSFSKKLKPISNRGSIQISNHKTLGTVKMWSWSFLANWYFGKTHFGI